MSANIYLCRVCGFNCSPLLPWGADGLIPSYEICPLCKVQFGYEDTIPVAIEAYKKRFIASGGQILNSD